MEQKKQKTFLVLEITAFESGRAIPHNAEQDIYHWQSMYYQTNLRFNISLREIFSKSASPRVMKKYDENALMQIFKELGPL